MRMSSRPPGAYEAPGCKPDVNTNAVMSSGRVKEKASVKMFWYQVVLTST